MPKSLSFSHEEIRQDNALFLVLQTQKIFIFRVTIPEMKLQRNTP